jgi:hypothetical protein
MSDERVDFLVANLSSAADIPDRQALARSAESSRDVKEFLNDPG